MAPQTKKYQFQAANLSALLLRNDPAATLTAEGALYIDVNWDNAVSSEAAVDDAMTLIGAVPAPAGAGDVFLTLFDPVSNRWDLSIDAGGKLFTTLEGSTFSRRVAAYPPGYMSGLAVHWLGVSQVQIQPGAASSHDNSYDLDATAPLVADITVVGPGGLDVGAEAANTWYAVYLIGDDFQVNPPAALLSTNFTAPNSVPAGYDQYRRVGAVRNTAASDFRKFFQRGPRKIFYDVNRTDLQALTDGTSAVFVDVALSAFIPPKSRHAYLLWGFASGVLGALGDSLGLRTDGSAAAPAPQAFRAGVLVAIANKAFGFTEMPTSDAQVVEYRVNDAVNNRADLFVLGYEDNLLP